MKIEEQPITTIEKSDLVAKCLELKNQGYRLVQISCTTRDIFELTYSFDKDYKLVSLRMTLPKENPVLPSITGSFFAAFTYENELQDLFGIKITDLALNFNGNFYKTAVKNPFATGKPSNPTPKG